MNRLRPILLISLAMASLLVVFQNCSPLKVSFNSRGSEKSLVDLGAGFGNGNEYGGKPEGIYYRFIPDFSCESQEAPTAVLTIASESDVRYRENSQFKCGIVDGPLSMERVTRSRMQNEFVSYQAIPFERKNAEPTAIPANLVEAWCRDLGPGALFEVVSHFDRTTDQAVARLYLGQDSGTGSVLVNMTPDAPVTRLVTPAQVHLRSSDFDLLIDRNRLSPAAGEFLADFKRGEKTTTLSCALGGALDPNIWPMQKLTNAPIIPLAWWNMEFSPDGTAFAFNVSLEPRLPETTSLRIDGALMTWKNGVLHAFPSLKSYLNGNLIRHLHFSSDAQTLFVTARASETEAPQLHRLPLAQGVSEQISSLQSTLIDFAIDPQETRIVGTMVSGLGNESQLSIAADPFSAKTLTFQPIINFPTAASLHYVIKLPNLNKMLLFFFSPKNPSDPKFNYPFHFEIANWDGSEKMDATPESPGTDWGALPTSLQFTVSRILPSDALLLPFYRQDANGCALVTRGVHLRTLQQMDFGSNVIPMHGQDEWQLLRHTSQPPVSCSSNDIANAPWTPRILNTTSGAQLDLAGYIHQSLTWSLSKTAILGFQKTSSTARTRWMRVDLTSLKSIELCQDHEGEWMGEKGPNSLAALRNEVALALSYSAGRVIAYTSTSDGRCSRVNGFPSENVPGTLEVKPAPDSSAVVVRLKLAPNGPQQLIYVPLNAANPPIQITSPRYLNSILTVRNFAGSDGKSVVLEGPTDPSGLRYVHIWKAPP